MSLLISDTPLDPRFIDVTVGTDGSVTRGCRPRTDRFASKFPAYEEAFADRMLDYPRSDWDDLLLQNTSIEILVRWLHNQLREGTCASNATDLIYEACLAMTLGQANSLMMSPIASYRWIASGPNSGSVISDNIEQLQKVGTLPVDTPENRAALRLMGLNENHVLKHTGYYQPFPEGWQETAAHFRIVEAYDVRTFEGAASAMFDDFGLVYGRAGHAIGGMTLVKRNGVYYIKYGNSWGPWGEIGDNGLQMFGYDSENFVRNSIDGYGAIAVRSVNLTEALLKLNLNLGVAA